MAVYQLRLNGIEARPDGLVAHDIDVLAEDDRVTSLHKTVLVPHYAITTALNMPTQGARVNAYKGAIWQYRNNQTPVVGEVTTWEFDVFAATLGAMDAYRDTLAWFDGMSLTLPVEFPLDSDDYD